MSLSFWLILAGTIGVCTFIFTKTVSTDAKNDYRIRDILNSAKTETPKKEVAKEEEPVPVAATPKQSFEEYQNEHNIYEEMAAKQKQSGYHSTYSSTTHVTEDSNKNYNENYKQEKVYYEKINDDACPEEETKTIYSNDDYEDEKDKYSDKKLKNNMRADEEETYTTQKKPYKSLFDYVKTFWRGITFTVGLLVCLYAFGGLAYNVQTSNDALVYSIWLLIGVILIK